MTPAELTVLEGKLIGPLPPAICTDGYRFYVGTPDDSAPLERHPYAICGRGWGEYKHDDAPAGVPEAMVAAYNAAPALFAALREAWATVAAGKKTMDSLIAAGQEIDDLRAAAIRKGVS